MSPFPIEPALPPRTKRLLVVGGTFDPPHRAHVQLAMRAAEAARCDHVLFVPVSQSPHKSDQPATAAHRVAMLRIALANESRTSISTLEIDRGGTSYTVDTLRALRAALSATVELRLFMGSDQLRSLPRWRKPSEIIQLAQPVVALRPPDSLAALRADGVPDEYLKWIIDAPFVDVSSTDVRAAIANGGDVSAVIEPRVLEYIRKHGLYGSRPT